MKIIYPTETGVAIVHPTGELSIEEVARKDVPQGVPFEIVDDTEIPIDRTFRNAWVKGITGIKTDMPKAKVIAHSMRQSMRSAEMKPYDDTISRQIPESDAAQAESSRALLRTKYATMQTNIDASSTETQLLAALDVMDGAG